MKSRVASVKEIGLGENVSYGRQFIAPEKMKIATITIGYADGLPRNLSETENYVLIHGKKAPIIGRICMDQIVVDINNIDDVKQGDIATIIGKDGKEEIRCEDLAERGNTITNEILCRLGQRLEFVYID